jgi:rhodanese-related sulfurtransferase
MPDLLKITRDKTKLIIETVDGPVEIVRKQNDMQLITGVLQPMVPVPGVMPVGELEVLASLADPEFLVVDMREPESRLKATIPGSVSIPVSEVTQRLEELGCTRDAKGWVCTVAKKVVAFCNGPACPQSPTAFHAMVREGFPPERIYYYRGGMQDWLVLGLTTTSVPAR